MYNDTYGYKLYCIIFYCLLLNHLHARGSSTFFRRSRSLRHLILYSSSCPVILLMFGVSANALGIHKFKKVNYSIIYVINEQK
jgi:hypothetical protein